MTSYIRIARGSKIASKKERYRVERGQKTWDVINERSLTQRLGPSIFNLKSPKN